MKRYSIVIEKATGNYSAYSPDVPGCAATGRTPEETRRNRKSALEIHLEGMAEDGDAPPEPTCLVEYVDVEEPTAAPVPRPTPPTRKTGGKAGRNVNLRVTASGGSVGKGLVGGRPKTPKHRAKESKRS